MKIGFELEAFLLDVEGKPQIVPEKLPLDECGWLVEIRSTPFAGIVEAVHLLRAEKEKVEAKVARLGFTLDYSPLKEISRELKVKAARKHGKGVLRYRNVYGYETHKNPSALATASLHISFTEEKVFNYVDQDKRERKFEYSGFVDHARLIVALDKDFKDEIKKAKRNPGFYEVKLDGRIEYRSLPNDVDLNKVTSVLGSLLPTLRT